MLDHGNELWGNPGSLRKTPREIDPLNLERVLKLLTGNQEEDVPPTDKYVRKEVKRRTRQGFWSMGVKTPVQGVH